MQCGTKKIIYIWQFQIVALQYVLCLLAYRVFCWSIKLQQDFCLSKIIQTWFSQIQEQPWNSNSARWKTLHTLIFNWKFQLLEYWRPLEALEKVYKITAPVWMDFKNSFAWLTGMKKQIFYQNKFFWFRPLEALGKRS